MWRFKLIGFAVAVQAFFLNLRTDPEKWGFEKADRDTRIRRIFRFPKDLLESSGLESDGTRHYTHTDSGGDPEIYIFNAKGDITDTLRFPELLNRDWEDMTLSERGDMFISDMGNNMNTRRDLAVYHLSDMASSRIGISYEEQDAFPPSEENMNFDSEALFWLSDTLNAVSKNRGERMVKLYRFPAKPGNYELSAEDSLYIPHQITAADYDPQNQRLALLGYGMIFTFRIEGSGKDALSYPEYAVRFARGGQAEGIMHLRGKEWWVSNESGKVFSIILP